MNYKFPVKDINQARDVLEVDFRIADYPQLFVDLEKARIRNKFQNYRASIKRYLNITDDRLERPVDIFRKILFTGFRGSGKSTELYRLTQELQGGDKYFVVFIDMEQKFEMEGFQYEDFYFILIYEFSKVLQETPQLKSKVYLLDDVLSEMLSETEIIKEITKSAKAGAEAETGGGLNIFNLFKAKIDIKADFSAGTKVAKQIRTKIRQNPLKIIRKFNDVLNLIRPEIGQAGLGKDLLFIIDSLERVDFKVYEQLIVRNSFVLREIQTNIILTIPTAAQYLASQYADKGLFRTEMLPVVDVTKTENRSLLGEVLTKRIDFETFFEDYEVLDYLVKMSGGVIRQLLNLTAFCLHYSVSDKLELNDVKESVREYGRQMYETLDDEQIKILRKIKSHEKDFRPANPQEGILLLNLFVLKYNGDYKINPVLDEWIDN